MLTKLLPALIKSQENIKHALKDKANPHFKVMYATLESVIDATKDELLKNKIIVFQQHTKENTLITRLIHESGEFLESEISLYMSKQDMQQLGSATTYARRYAITSMLNIAQEDDDGNATVTKPETKPKFVPTPKKELDHAPPEQYIIQSGKLKGKMLKDMALDDVQKQIDSINAYFKKQGGEAYGSVKDDLNMCIKYLNEQAELKELK